MNVFHRNTNSAKMNMSSPLAPKPATVHLEPGIAMPADPVSDYGSSRGTTRLVTGDLNNDGFPDIAAAHGFRTAGVFLNGADRTFAAERRSVRTLVARQRQHRRDFGRSRGSGRDGNLDMVVPIYGDHVQGRMVQVFRGLGDGRFEVWPVDGYNGEPAARARTAMASTTASCSTKAPSTRCSR